MTVSNQIIQVLDALCEKFGIAINWTSENVIPHIATLVDKLVFYEIWTSVAWIAIMTILSVIGIVLTNIYYPVFKKGLESQTWFDESWTIASVFAVIGLGCLYTATIVVIGVQIFDIIKCSTFPEMYVFEYVQGVINSVK